VYVDSPVVPIHRTHSCLKVVSSSSSTYSLPDHFKSVVSSPPFTVLNNNNRNYNDDDSNDDYLENISSNGGGRVESLAIIRPSSSKV
jgi:hypothetical protein